MANPAFIEVVFPIPLDKAFHYRVPSAADGTQIALGARVLAPFGGKKQLVGYVVGTTNDVPPFPTKEAHRVLDAEPFITPSLMELARWLSERYLCSLGEALACMAPPPLAPPKRPKSALSAVEEASVDNEAIRLSSEQHAVLDPLIAAIERRGTHPFLLRGITDSGKTEIYLRAIDCLLNDGRQALFMVPEIALTPHFVDRLTRRYPAGRVGVWHSHLAPSERFETWSHVRSGDIGVLLGARSAVFAPFRELGLIVIDEEHEPSYKQEDRPRYHTREVAIKRAALEGAVVVMGSATPSLESYWNAKHGVYRLLELTSRVEQKSLPPVTLIDRRPAAAVPPEGKKRKRRWMPAPIFAEPLRLAIEQRLARREQAMLFVNRRGYTPFLRCATCGWVARCKRCSLTLTLHLKDFEHPGKPAPADAMLRCHHCSYEEAVPIQCPSCKGMRLRDFGIGTQRVEQELKQLFPFVKVGRMDRDIASSRHNYQRIYRAFADGSLDVLVGTQMIAKGFDFPNVTLVGVVDADVSLHLPDFRAAERTFDLIAQVAGRTGRGAARGQVFVQTHHPEHYALQAAREHDFLKFYDQEIGFREIFRYPPFSQLMYLLIRGTKEPVVRQSAEELAVKLSGIGTAELLGPVPAPYVRLRNQFRYQIILKGSEEVLRPYRDFLRGRRLSKAFLSVDVDPSDLL